MLRPRPEIERALQLIIERLAEPLTAADIARAVGMSELVNNAGSCQQREFARCEQGRARGLLACATR